MKKLISGVVAAFLLSVGFVAVSAETASAACKPSRYVECKPTATSATGPKTVKKGKKPKTAITIKAQGAGGVKPAGTATVTYKGPGVNKTIKVKVVNGKASVTGPALKKKGTYTVTVKFAASNDFKDPKTVTYKIKVK
jgi:hypothetical protein